MKFIPTQQRERAAEMRNAPTMHERMVWRMLRSSGLGGVKFSRQIAIGPYIADFVARNRMLVIEIDGKHHGGSYDVARQVYIEAQGVRVLRFGNQEVRENLEGIMQTIWEALKACPEVRRAVLAQVPPPTPPVPGGEQTGGDLAP